MAPPTPTLASVQNQMIVLQNTYNSNRQQMTNNYINNVYFVRSTRYSSKYKTQLIQLLYSDYLSRLNTLTNQFNYNMSTLKKLAASLTPVPVLLPLPLPFVQTFKKTNAVVIGMNYTGTSSELYGCINDANDVSNFLIDNGFDKKNIQLMTDTTPVTPTKTNILNAFKNLLVNAKAGDFVVFFDSSHGSTKTDLNGDEESGIDQAIYTIDSQLIIDDEFKSLIQTYLHKDATLFAVFDCCFSGTVLDLPYQYLDSLNNDANTVYKKESETIGNVIMISGSTDEQTSSDSVFNERANGALTRAFLDSYDKTKKQTYRELLKSIRNYLSSYNFPQIPQLSSGKSLDIDAPLPF